jgi:peptidoglycan/xylan/chitin deacetylase (PgdA/CDA1 family)
MKNKIKILLYTVSAFLVFFILDENVNAMIIKNITRPIKDINTSLEEEISPNKKLIYLTFDDGPSVVTAKMLDILKENNVKATFFLIGNQISGFEDIVRRMHDEGHSIGLHTYTHKFKRIYSSSDTFIKEMISCRDEINKLTGTSPNIIRFPGGSRKRMTYAFLNKLHSYNFRVYDWDMETLDGINPKITPSRLFMQATKGCEEISPIILLMHCDYMHKNTCLALPPIINFYKKQGYEFKIITEDTPELYFPIVKKG